MTSTEIRTGYSENKPSSRVLKPPGGGESNIFGPATAGNNSGGKVNRMESNVFKEPETAPQPVSSKKEDTHNNLFGEQKMKVKTDFNAATVKGQGYFKDPIRNSGAPTESSEVMHTRISQPPGGHCHQLW